MAERAQVDPGFERRCAGFVFEGIRHLAPAERHALVAVARLQRLRGCLALMGIPLIGALLVYMHGFTELGDAVAPAVKAAVWIAFGGLGVPILALTAGDGIVRSGQLLKDARHQEVEVFRGSVVVLSQEEPLLAMLVRKELLPCEGEHSLERLPGSGFVYRADETRVLGRWIPSKVATVAIRGELASDAYPGQALEPDPESEENYAGRLRPLRPAEREELESHVRRLQRSPAHVVVPVAMLGLSLTLWLALGDATPRHHGFFLVIGSLMVARPAFGWFVRLRASAKMRRDLRDGSILVITRFSAYEAASTLPSEADPPAEAALPMVIEYLPHHEACWTVDGQPAEWRYDEE